MYEGVNLQEVLQCKYPKWAIDKVLKQEEDREDMNRRNKAETTPTKLTKDVT